MNPAERLRTFRERMQLGAEAVAAQIGVDADWYTDMEADPEYLEESLDFEQVKKLSVVLEVSLTTLLTGDPPDDPQGSFSLPELRAKVNRHLGEGSEAREELEERIGWDLTPFLRDAEEGWGYKPGFFRDLCSAMGLDWKKLLSRYE